MEKDTVELNDLMRHYELHNRTEGKSPDTIAWYNVILKLFHRFLVESDKSTKLGDLNDLEVREFILSLQDRVRWEKNDHIRHRGKLKSISVQTYVRALKAFFNWLYIEGYTNENRLSRLKAPKAERKLKEILTETEINRILNSLDMNTDAGCRDYSITMLLLDSGLRCGEVASAKLAEVNIEGGYLKVMGKGSKERVVPFGATTQKALLRYLLHFRSQPFHPGIQNFFLTVDGKPLSENGVKMIFRRLAQRSGVKRLHPHLCRHTFATNYLINGGDVFSLQQILGHTTLEMVRTYVTLASAHVTVQHRKFSPMDRISLNNGRHHV